MADLLTIPILGYEKYYLARSDGEIYSIKNKIFLKQRVNKSGYKQCTLCYDGKRKMIDVHRIIARSFIQNLDNKKTVNHKDGNKLNNNIDNLEWMTYKENTNHAINILGIRIGQGDIYGKKNGKARKTAQYTKEGNLIKIWDYAKQATSSVDISLSMITACCRGERKTGGGFVWKYL